MFVYMVAGEIPGGDKPGSGALGHAEAEALSAWNVYYARQIEPLDRRWQQGLLAQDIEAGVLAAERLEQGDTVYSVEDLQALVTIGRTAMSRFVEANLPMVVQLARYYVGSGVEYADLVQEGSLGLILAVQSFDYKRGVAFYTHGKIKVRRALQLAVLNRGRPVRIPRKKGERLNAVANTAETLAQGLGREPTVDEIAEAVDMEVGGLERLQSYDRSMVSLDAPVFADEGDGLSDFLGDEMLGPVDLIEQSLTRETLYGAIGRLPADQQVAVVCRAGLNGGEPLEFGQIGDILGVDKNRAKRLYYKAVSSLRGLLEGLEAE